MGKRFDDVDAIKIACVVALCAYLDSNRISQNECVSKLMYRGVSFDQPKLSKLLNHKFEGVAIDRILRILMALEIPFVIEI